MQYECQKPEFITRESLHYTAAGKPVKIVQRGLTLAEERAARRLSGFQPSMWDYTKLGEYLKSKGKQSLKELDNLEQAEVMGIALIKGGSSNEQAYQFTLLKVCFSMGGKTADAGSGDMGLGEGWDIEGAPVTPAAVENTLRDEDSFDTLIKNLNDLTEISPLIEKK